MIQLQRFLNRSLNQSKLEDTRLLKKYGTSVRYLPETFEFLDETELLLDYTPERDIVIAVAVEGNLIKRIMIGWAPVEGAEDDFNPFPEQELQQMLAEKGDILVELFDELTT